MYAKANQRRHFPFTFYEHSAPLSRQIKLQNHEIKATYIFRKGNAKLKQCTFKKKKQQNKTKSFFYVNMSEQSVF